MTYFMKFSGDIGHYHYYAQIYNYFYNLAESRRNTFVQFPNPLYDWIEPPPRQNQNIAIGYNAYAGKIDKIGFIESFDYNG